MKKTSKKALRTLVEAQSRGQKEIIYNEGTEDELKVVVVSAIPYTKRTVLISELVALNFAGDASHINDYMPSALEFARKYTIVRYYSDLKLPTNLDELWLILNHTSIFQDIYDFVGDDIDKIFDEADKQIEAKLAYLANQSDLNLFLGNISKVVEKFGDALKDVDIHKLISVLGNMSQFSSEELVDSILKVKPDEVEVEQK